jgi:ubiquinone/menaquinone biosynthesis C-methylase UbiE
MKEFIQKLTPKYFYFNKCFQQSPFKLLDVGSGNHSPSKTKKLFPNCEYHGIDLNSDYNYNEEDLKAMHSFYEMNLDDLNFDAIPDNYFDFISMNHIIEHLKFGDQAIRLLTGKLKPGGYIYIEYPGQKSTKLPSMHGTLNFYDDPTHVRIYSVQEIVEILNREKLKPISSGTRRNLVFLLAMPFRILGNILKRKKLQGNIFWDLLGFAEYVFARKIN